MSNIEHKNAREQLDNILADPRKMIDEIPVTESGILARLARTIMLDNRINPFRMETYIRQYLHNMTNMMSSLHGAKQAKSQAASIKGNLIKTLVRPEYTWRTFTTFIRLIGATRLDLTVRLHFKNGKFTEHNISQIFHTGNNEGDLDDE